MHSDAIQIGVAREGFSPENPCRKQAATDLRVALVPPDVERLLSQRLSARVRVLVEDGAGKGISFTPSDYEKAGARIVSSRALYAESDVVLKLKGPSDDDIRAMKPGALLSCFAHLASFPGRAQAARDAQVNVLSLEEVLESPAVVTRDVAFARQLASKTVPTLILETPRLVGDELEVLCYGFSKEMFAFAQQSARFGTRVSFLNGEADSISVASNAAKQLFVYDSSRTAPSPVMLGELQAQDATLLDFESFGDSREKLATRYFLRHPTEPFGIRRVQCLTETGVCGARYGFELLREISPRARHAADSTVVVLGYGNVAEGAILEALRQGVPRVHIVGREQSHPSRIEPYLHSADLIINGIDLGAEKGLRHIITAAHVADNIVGSGAVIIDLVGGSDLEPSAIESIPGCTFLDNPYFEKSGVFFSALWGWPMMYMMRESAATYSKQISSLLVEAQDFLLRGVGAVPAGVERALYVNTPRPRSRHAANQSPFLKSWYSKQWSDL